MKLFLPKTLSFPARQNAWPLLLLLVAGALAGTAPLLRASLPEYDATITADAGAGLTPAARLSSAVVLTGANQVPFDFGATAGEVTMEFILEGNPSAISSAGYLAVGANTGSNLRYEQYNNTGQLGFTQLGVLDYLFNPAVLSPTQATHITYTWDAVQHTMKLYVNGLLAGTRTGVSTSFAMPTGVGYLGAAPNNSQNMVGTIHRVTVYDDLVAEEVIRLHADAFNGIVRPPAIGAFTATPEAIFAPGSATLAWNVVRATRVTLNGADVTTLSNLVVTPAVTTTYTLIASNAGGSVSAQLTVTVNPAPVIRSFTASRSFILPGETITLEWDVLYGQEFSITPGIGDVSAQTLDGQGSLEVQPASSLTCTLSAANEFGTNTASVDIHFVQPANHLVISEFVADDTSALPDEDGEFSGWIEIFNPTSSAANLTGHFLTDDARDPTKWPFPGTNLPPGGYLVVFASGKDRRSAGAPLHASFQLNNGGEYLALVGPGPVLLHAFAPAYPPQRENVAYGILDGDPALARYLGTPTPGARNDDQLPPPAPVQFSPGGGVFTEPVTVELSVPDPGAEIRYTLNGALPSATNGFLYTAPLVITNTTRLRAVALVTGKASPVAGAGYLKLAGDLAGYTSSLPIMVIENFGAGIIQQKGWNSTGAGLKQVPRQAAIWATFERAGGTSALTNAPQMFSLVGIRGRGAASTTWRQKTYSVEALDESGQEVKVSPLGMPAHADWVLYYPDGDASFSPPRDLTLLFNTFAYELSQNSGHYAARFRWVEALINEDGGDLSLADRRGVYAIVEKVARGTDRLDFQKFSTDGTTGSWLLNINRMDPEPETGWPAPNGATQPWFFRTAGANRLVETAPNTSYNPVPGDDQPRQYNAFFNFDNPTGYTVTPNQRAVIEGWFTQFEDVLYNDAVWRDPVNGYRRYIDVLDFADYFIINVLTRNGDGILISLYPWKGDDGKLRIGPVWDYNYNSYYPSNPSFGNSPTGALMHRADRLWYARLFADPDFLQFYIDRWWDLRRGPMSNAAMDAIVDRQSADIGLEKALLNGIPSVTEWTNRLGQMKTWLKTRADWIDSNYLRPPAFNHEGGSVPEGFQLFITGTNGTIYFTTDGSDPRLSGGAVASAAQAYQGGIVIQAQTLLQARIKNGTNWSGLTSALFAPPQNLTQLAVTEIMYNPPALGDWSADDLEFIELKNTGTNSLHLGTLTFTAGITFTFASGTRLDPGQFLVLARNAAAFQSKYPGVAVGGIYSGKLDNGGETLRLATPSGSTVFDVTYNDRAPWPLAADGHGFSAVPRTASGPANSDAGAHWRASTLPGGSPGADDSEPTIAPVIINEILSHTLFPAMDAIELFNPTAHDVDISGWYLSDDGTVPKKFRIPDGTIIAAGGYHVCSETDFNPVPATLYNFALDSAGDAIYLVSADAAGNLTGYSHGVDFGAAAAGISFGRYVNSVGEEQFPPQLAVTLDETNAGPIVGPVVIAEIHYHPDEGGCEFVELKNLASDPMPLFDGDRPTNTWRLSGLAFDFPTNIVLAPQGLLLIVATNPADFRAQYSVPEDVPVLGPCAGALQDNGERLELQRPAWMDTNQLEYITVDEVRYDDQTPWPPGADGSGPSLQRKSPAAYGNDPINWEAASPTPGVDYLPGQLPVITTQPLSQTVYAQQEVAFSVDAAGTSPLQFQWLLNGVPLPGATNLTLILTNVQAGQGGCYQAVVFNGAGSIASGCAQLKVVVPVTILRQPANVSTNTGRTVNLTVSAVGTGWLRYQWAFNGSDLTSATNATLTLTNVQLPQAGLYTVLLTDEVSSMASAPARLVVLVDPTIVQSPLSQTVVPGSSVTLSVSVTNTATLPIGYRWRRNGIFLTGGYLALSQHTCFFTVTNAQPAYTNYSVAVTNAARPGGIPSASAMLTFLTDTDSDGLPDVWEIAAGLNAGDPQDRWLDSDSDGLLNWQEYVAGTDPTNAASFLKIEAASAGGNAVISFNALSNRTYTVLYTDAVENPLWSKLADVVARPINRTEFIPDSAYQTNRFYRLVIPQSP